MTGIREAHVTVEKVTTIKVRLEEISKLILQTFSKGEGSMTLNGEGATIVIREPMPEGEVGKT